MSSITTVVNGVTCTLSPAIFENSGPTGQAIDFSSQAGFSPSLPITINFNELLTYFQLTIVGLQGEHNTAFYDQNGSLIATTRTTPLPNGQDPMVLLDLTIQPTGRYLSRVVLIPPTSNTSTSVIPVTGQMGSWVGYKGLTVTPLPNSSIPPITTVPPITAIPTPPPPTVTLPTGSGVNLADFIVLIPTEIDMQYFKGSLSGLTPQTISLQNTSTDMDVNISFNPFGGVSFNPSSFPLAKTQKQNVVVTFNAAQIDTLPEGINILDIAINVTSNAAVVIPNPPISVPIPVPTPTPVSTQSTGSTGGGAAVPSKTGPGPGGGTGAGNTPEAL